MESALLDTAVVTDLVVIFYEATAIAIYQDGDISYC